MVANPIYYFTIDYMNNQPSKFQSMQQTNIKLVGSQFIFNSPKVITFLYNTTYKPNVYPIQSYHHNQFNSTIKKTKHSKGISLSNIWLQQKTNNKSIHISQFKESQNKLDKSIQVQFTQANQVIPTDKKQKETQESKYVYRIQNHIKMEPINLTSCNVFNQCGGQRQQLDNNRSYSEQIMLRKNETYFQKGERRSIFLDQKARKSLSFRQEANPMIRRNIFTPFNHNSLMNSSAHNQSTVRKRIFSLPTNQQPQILNIIEQSMQTCDIPTPILQEWSKKAHERQFTLEQI